MPFNGSGQFSKVFSWEADAAAGINITASRFDTQESDFTGNGFDNCLTRDGQGQATANLPMAGFRHTGVGDGQAATDYASVGQAQSGSTNWTTAGGSADALTAIFTPAIAALTDGLILHVRAASTNVTTTPTFAPNGLTAHTITKDGGNPVAAGDITASAEIILRYNLANTRWELMNPPAHQIGVPVPYFGGSLPSNYVTPTGQNLSSSTYPALNAVLGTTYGNPGGGNFTCPDLRGRIPALMDSGGSTRLNSMSSTVLGATGGAQTTTVSIAQANLPSLNFTVSGIALNDPTHNHIVGNSQAVSTGGGVNVFNVVGSAETTNAALTGITVSSQGTAASGGSGTSLSPNIIQPTMVINCMMRVA